MILDTRLSAAAHNTTHYCWVPSEGQAASAGSRLRISTNIAGLGGEGRRGEKAPGSYLIRNYEDATLGLDMR